MANMWKKIFFLEKQDLGFSFGYEHIFFFFYICMEFMFKITLQFFLLGYCQPLVPNLANVEGLVKFC